jgi:hypothetical protein
LYSARTFALGAKDAAIDEKLAKIGLSSVRVPGKLIIEDAKAAADLVSNALASVSLSHFTPPRP